MRWQRDLIVAAIVVLALGCGPAAAASPQASAQNSMMSHPRHLGLRHRAHGYTDRRYVPSYLDRPVYYAPAPVFVFPSYLGYD